MAQAKFFTSDNAITKSVKNANFFYSKINSFKRKIKFIDSKSKVKSVRNKNYPVAKIENVDRQVKVEEFLPFRVKFINIGIEGYGPSNPPGLGVAIIGYNNYIL